MELPIPGRFTVHNALTVLGITSQLGLPLEDCAQALGRCQGVKGRVEVVPTPGKPYSILIDYAHTPDGLENVLRSVRDFCKGRLICQGVKGRVEVVPTPGKPYSILIDYAHTPDGLENVLRSVRDFCKGRLIAVFGCGGDRDPMKRPIMGSIGVKLSDLAIITSDNPRTEEPSSILADILKGIKKEDGEYIVIEDRRKAIKYAMDIGKKDDIIVLAGKGHETYQDIGGHKYHLDEREEVAAHLAETRN